MKTAANSDSTRSFNKGWRRLAHAEEIFNELFIQALSAKAFGNAYKPKSDDLVRAVIGYRHFGGVGK